MLEGPLKQQILFTKGAVLSLYRYSTASAESGWLGSVSVSVAPEGIYNPSRLERVSSGSGNGKSGRQPGTWREETAECEGGPCRCESFELTEEEFGVTIIIKVTTTVP
ncbi:UNVERIFIED_CONTAM: hypothetical protein K2H54_049199 [Gekko kuhli]